MDVSLQDWKAWSDSHGFVSDKKAKGNGGITHNGLMFSIYKARWFYEHERQYPNPEKKLIELYESCKTHSGMNRVPSGWPVRALQQNDDYYACGLFDCYMGTDLSDHILTSHRANGGFIDNRDPDGQTWKAFIFRMPQLKSHLKVCSKREHPGPIDTLIWCLWISLGGIKHRDSRVKKWMAHEAYKIRRESLRIHPLMKELMDVAGAIFMYRFRKKFPLGVGQAEYFVEDHPNTLYMTGKF